MLASRQMSRKSKSHVRVRQQSSITPHRCAGSDLPMESPMTPSRTTTTILVVFGFLFLNLCGFVIDAQAQQIQVNAADPPAAEQGTITLDVKVTGKGFKNGAKAKWFVTGTADTGGVTVNSTTFVSSSELRANITVSDTAVISGFDIQVLNNDGRGGKGTGLFRVTAKGGGNACLPEATTPCLTGSGCLDQTFNGNGQALTNTDGTVPSIADIDGAKAVMAQNDGKLVAVGLTSVPFDTGYTHHIFVARYNSNGTLDNAFGDLDLIGTHTGITRVSVLHRDRIMYGGGAL